MEGGRGGFTDKVLQRRVWSPSGYASYHARASIHTRPLCTLVNFRLAVDPCVPKETEAAVARSAYHIVTAAVVLTWCRHAVVFIHLAHVPKQPLGASAGEPVGTRVATFGT